MKYKANEEKITKSVNLNLQPWSKPLEKVLLVLDLSGIKNVFV